MSVVRIPGTRRPSYFRRVDLSDPIMRDIKIRLLAGLTPIKPRAAYGGSVPAGSGAANLDRRDCVGFARATTAAGLDDSFNVIDGRPCFDFYLDWAPAGEQRQLAYYNDPTLKVTEQSCSAWVWIPSGGGNVRRIIISRYQNWQFRHEGGNRLLYEYTGGNVVNAPSNTINDDRWHHVALTLSHVNQRGRIYEDGELVVEGAYDYGFSQTWGVIFASRDNSLRWQRAVDCRMDDFCFWNRELQPDEVREFYKHPWAAFTEYRSVPTSAPLDTAPVVYHHLQNTEVYT